jgi:hypothetical protein
MSEELTLPQQLASDPKFINDVQANISLSGLKMMYTDCSPGTVARAYHIAKQSTAGQTEEAETREETVEEHLGILPHPACSRSR